MKIISCVKLLVLYRLPASVLISGQFSCLIGHNVCEAMLCRNHRNWNIIDPRIGRTYRTHEIRIIIFPVCPSSLPSPVMSYVSYMDVSIGTILASCHLLLCCVGLFKGPTCEAHGLSAGWKWWRTSGDGRDALLSDVSLSAIDKWLP